MLDRNKSWDRLYFEKNITHTYQHLKMVIGEVEISMAVIFIDTKNI